MKKSFIAIICLISLVFTFSGNGIVVYAQDSKDETVEVSTTTAEKTAPISKVEIAQNISAMEQELSSRGTDVITELEKQIDYYQSMLNTFVSQEQAEQIESLISTTQELITEYQAFINRDQTRSEDDSTYYSAAVAAAITTLSSVGCNLAAELLTHAKDNNDLDSIYAPINGNDVLGSSVYTNIRNGNILESTGVFDSSYNIDDLDLHLAINKFYYSKSASGRVVVIQDRYDFDSDEYNSYNIIGIVVETMHDAQEAGIIVPYYTVITNNFEGTSSNQSESTTPIVSSTKYYEDKVTIGSGEYKEYYITFRGSGTKVFQTFGMKDTYMSLYDANGNLIKRNDDGGYRTNALIRYDCSANVQYKVRVQFYSSTQSGETKLLITPSSGALKSGSSALNTYEDIYNTSSSNFTFNTFSTAGYVRLLTYTPSEKAYYTVEAQADQATYICGIDPRSTYLSTSPDLSVVYARGENAHLSKELAPNIPYLIIYCRSTINSADLDITLRIYKN